MQTKGGTLAEMISAKPNINYKIDTMKKIILLIVLLFNLNLFSQTYVLDSSFGDLGTKQYNNGLYHVRNGLLVNNNYYFISTNTMTKMDYNGQIVTTFGTNGYKALQQTNETLTVVNFVFYNNYFYLYGSVKNNTTNNLDIYISKIDESGNYDSSFGTNGIVKLDFGLQENISSLAIESSGNLYCIGSRNNESISNTSRLILFKIDNNNGSVNTLFNSNGFQEINLNLYTTGAEIIPYNSEYMLLGTATEFDGTYNRTKMMITEVDSNGNINTTFGVNGFKIIPLANGGDYYNTIKKAEILNDILYINMNQGGAMLGDNENNLLIYNLVSSQVVSSVTHNQYFYNKVTNDGVLITSYCFSCCGTNYHICNNTFELRKMNLDGSITTNFHINGVYSYEFAYPQPIPNVTFGGDSRSYLFIVEPNGKILIAGFVYNQGSTPGLSAIRIVEGPLGLNNAESTDTNLIYPNPFKNEIFFKNSLEITNIEVSDLSGRTIKNSSFKYDNNTNSINLSEINASGIYFIKITTKDGKVLIKKIVKN